MASSHATNYSLRRLTLRLFGSTGGGVGVRERFLALATSAGSVTSSGILCKVRTIFLQYSCLAFPFRSSNLRISSMKSCNWPKRSMPSAFHPPYFFWPSLVSVHLAAYGSAAAPFLGICAPGYFRKNEYVSWTVRQKHYTNFVALTRILSFEFHNICPLVTTIIINKEPKSFAANCTMHSYVVGFTPNPSGKRITYLGTSNPIGSI